MNNFDYHHQLSPFLFQTEIAGQTIGVRWYGLAYVLGLWAAFATFRWAARRDVLRDFGDEAQGQFIIAVLLGVLAGGRLGYVVQHPQRVFANPLYVFQVWEGGMAFFGGLVGVMLAMA
jgi:phosphatidylglycerol:prolipoprotein diacylglycerol transferase